jgi:hypothetical protein
MLVLRLVVHNMTQWRSYAEKGGIPSGGGGLTYLLGCRPCC